MWVPVRGGRDYTDRRILRKVLDDLALERDIDVVIHGDAVGSNRMAGEWASLSGIRELAFPADWEKFRRAAGPIRNRQVLVEAAPDVVVASPGGRRAANMIRQARAAGVPVHEHGPRNKGRRDPPLVLRGRDGGRGSSRRSEFHRPLCRHVRARRLEQGRVLRLPDPPRW
jgi:hypothetical protein